MLAIAEMSPKSIFPETITPRTISPKTIPPKTLPPKTIPPRAMRPQAPARPRAGAAWATLCRGALQLGGGLTIALALQSSLPEQAAAQFVQPPLPASEEPADAKPRTSIVPQTEEFKQATED
ncbi:MAG: hypothetical protein KDA45_01225, partial [Planctomycetales bacterium]|nr:hypothetical protein [Planctomycetales bacterium]